jgi:glycoside/pentoside/hexuronide:cation symporter, GPH family
VNTAGLEARSSGAKADPLSRGGLLAYVAYAIPLTGLSAAIVNLVPAYYAEKLGLSLTAVGAVFFLLRMFDAVTDPLMGWLLDRHPFRQQHKPWLLLSFPVFLVSIGLLFFPLREWVGIPYLLGAGFMAYSAYTIGLVTHQAWGASLARDARSLSTLMGTREVAVIFGILGVFLAPALAEGFGYEGLEAKVVAAASFLSVCFVLFTPITLYFAPDEPKLVKPEALGFDAAREFVSGRRFILISIANLATSFSMVALSVVSYFVATYVFDSTDRYGLGMTVYFVSAFLGMAVWMRVARRIGDRRTLIVAVAYAAAILAFIPIWSTIESSARYPIFMAILGLGFGAPPYLIRSMIGALANEYEDRTDRAVRGTAYAVTTFFDKLGSGMAAGAVLPLVAWLGFNPVDGGGGDGRVALLWVSTLAPILGFVVAAIAIGSLGSERSRSEFQSATELENVA